MPSRRPHTNSHHGCLQCKAKRVKCDQAQPTCSRCEKRGSECTYRHLMTSYNPFQAQRSAAGPSNVPPPISIPGPANPQHAQRASQEMSPSMGTPGSRRLSTPGISASFYAPTTLTPPQSGATTMGMTATSEVDPPRQHFSASSAPPDHLPFSTQSPAMPSSIPVAPSTASSADFSDHIEQYLLHHYMENLTVPHMSPVLHLNLFPALNRAILEHAPSTPYVRHLVLSFSALHLASLTAGSRGDVFTSTQSSQGRFDFNTAPAQNPNPFYNHHYFLSLALDHKDKALQLFVPAVREGITEANGERLFAASTVVIACELGLPAGDPENRTAFDRIDILAQVAGLFQGTHHLFNTVEGFRQLNSPEASGGGPATGGTHRASVSTSASSATSLSSSSPSGAHHQGHEEIDWPQGIESVARVLALIECLPETSDQAELDRRDALIHAGQKLSRAFATMDESEESIPVCNWLGMVKGKFVELIRARDPLALVLIGHWTICPQRMNDIWWARGWPAAAVMDIDNILDESHKPLLEWCFHQTTTQESTLGPNSQQPIAGYRAGYSQ